jgi:holliday junction DNA helicase ruvA
MYSYIIGKVISKSKNILILENNNIGYEIYMTEIALSELSIGEDAKIYTYYNVTQDNISLFGFKNLEEKKMFENLISVSKIGAKTAIGILSSISTAELAISIITNDINRLSKLPGIGKKTAQRLVLEVIDKVKTEEIIFTEEEQESNENYLNTTEKEKDVIEALKVLGYNIKEIDNVIKTLDIKSSTEDMIKQALKILR